MRDLKELETLLPCRVFTGNGDLIEIYENIEPVHDLPKDRQSRTRSKKFVNDLFEGKGLEFPPVLFYNSSIAKSGCHRQHSCLEVITMYNESEIEEIPQLVPCITVSNEDLEEFFLKLTGGKYSCLYNLADIQEVFHKYLVKHGFYTKRILKRRLSDIKKS